MDMDKDAVAWTLREIDMRLMAFGAESAELTLAGSAAMLLQVAVPDWRTTSDIDVLERSENVGRFLREYGMNDSVNTFLFTLPENWRSRRVRVVEDTVALRAYTPSLADLAIMKLVSGRTVDISDLELLAGHIPWDEVRRIVGDVAELRVNLDDASYARVLETLSELGR